MWDFKLGQVFGLLLKTSAFLVFRFLIYMGIVVAYILAVGIGAGVGALTGSILGSASGTGGGAGLGGLFGFGVASVVLYWAREYILYMVKAGHIAVLVELMQGKQIPGGKGQISYASEVVHERLGESSSLFALDLLIKGILRVFNRMIMRIGRFIPIPAAQNLIKMISAVVSMSLTYVDEIILAYSIKTESTNPWASARTAVVLYAQNYKTMLKNAVFLTLFVWMLTFVVFLVVLAPVALIVSLFPGVGGFLTLGLALIVAWGIKQAVIEPFAMCALMQVFFQVIEGQEPNAEWEAKLESWTPKFAELKQKAIDAGGEAQVGKTGGAAEAGASLPPAQ